MNSADKFLSHLYRWLIIGVITIFVWMFFQQVFIKPIIETVATQMIGARVTMGSFSLNILTHRVQITDLHIYNEQGFPPKIFFVAPEILADIDLFQAMQGKMHFPLIIFHLKKMVVYKNPQGKLNVDELKIVKEKLHDKNKGPVPNFKIDVLKLNIEEVIVEDETQTPALVEAYDLNLKDKTFYNIDSVSKLIGLMMVETLKPTAIQSAELYAATTLLGVAFLPGLAIGIAIANDEAVADLPHSESQIYDQSLQLVKRLGLVKKTASQAGEIWAKVYNCDITITVLDHGWGKSGIVIKARKYFLAKPEIAAGLLYQLEEDLK